MSENMIVAALARLQASVEHMQGDVAGMKGDILNLLAAQHSHWTELTARMDRLEAAQIQYRTDMMERIDRLQNTLTTQRESEIVTLGAGERAERIAKAASDEVRLMSEQFGALTRLVRTLQHAIDEMRRDHP